MSIKELQEKIKGQGSNIILITTIFLVAFASFGLGRLSKNQEIPETKIVIEKAPPKETDIFIASKLGKKYYLPWCSGVNALKKENLITFKSSEEAEMAGYSPANNCLGI